MLTAARAPRPPTPFGSLSTETLPRRVARALVGGILLGQFKPGESLPAAGDLAREFEVSRPVVREALKIVATLGMVTSRQGRYSRVTERTSWNDLAPDLLATRLEVGAIDDIIIDSLELRRVIETEAAALAAERATPEDLASMREEFAALRQAAHNTDAYTAHDVAFHDAVLRSTHNRLFLQLIDQMREVLVLTRTVSVTADPDRVPASQHGHEAIFEAIEAGAPERARQAMADHLGWAERVNVSDYRISHPSGGGRGRLHQSRSETSPHPSRSSWVPWVAAGQHSPHADPECSAWLTSARRFGDVRVFVSKWGRGGSLPWRTVESRWSLPSG
jgi:DNA-binding FadR family transcriptional regulator